MYVNPEIIKFTDDFTRKKSLLIRLNSLNIRNKTWRQSVNVVNPTSCFMREVLGKCQVAL